MTKLKNLKISAEDLRIIGPEPEWTSYEDYTSLDLMNAFNWYNYAVDPRERPRLLAELFPEDANEIRAVPFYRVTGSVLSLARMRARGYTFTSDQQGKFDAWMDEIRTEGARILSAPKSTPTVKTMTSSEIEKRLRDVSIADLEQEIDRFIESNYKYSFSLENWFRDRRISSKCAEAIVKYYEPLVAELNEVANIRKDRELVQAYSRTKPKDLKKYHEFVVAIVEKARSLIKEEVHESDPEKLVVVRKPRKKKAVDPKKLVAKLKFQKEETSLGLTSIEDLTKLVGATEIWTFNTKYRTLCYYKGKAKSSLTIKGQSILGYDETASIQKKIRKPETLAAMIDQGAKTTYNDFIALKTASSTCNGRINPLTLILRVNK